MALGLTSAGPTRDMSLVASRNVLHSALTSITLSATTSPQSGQIMSPA